MAQHRLCNRWTRRPIAVLTSESLSHAVIIANVRRISLASAYLPQLNLSDTILSSIDFRGANLVWANLSGSCLYKANLRGADLRCANFNHCFLRSADLRDADLRGAYFAGADLCGAMMHGADLRQATLPVATPRGIVCDNGKSRDTEAYRRYEQLSQASVPSKAIAIDVGRDALVFERMRISTAQAKAH